MVTEEFIKPKLTQIIEAGDEAAIAFVTVVLNGGGICRKGRRPGDLQGFRHYGRQWGQDKLQEVNKHLVEERVLREDKRHLTLNCPKEELDATAQFMFKEAAPFYMSAIKETLARPKGDYLLAEMGNEGHHFSEKFCQRVSREAGAGYWHQAKVTLSRAGLLVRTSEKRHRYYRLFPPLISLIRMDSVAHQEALAFVYIAQNVREKCGVLAQDLPCPDEVDQLTALGLVKRLQWNKLSGFATTPEGQETATSILQERIERSRDKMISLLSSFPGKLAEFIVRECLLSQEVEGKWVAQPERLPNFALRENFPNPIHLCLLDDGRVWSARNEFFDALVKNGLMVKVRHGKVSGLEFVAAPEIEPFLQGYLVAQNISGPLFPPELEAKHRLYHFLIPAYEPFYSEHFTLPGEEYPPPRRRPGTKTTGDRDH